MSTRKKPHKGRRATASNEPATIMPPGKVKGKALARASAGGPGNGMRTFAMHALDEKTAPLFARLREERAQHPAFALAGPAGIARLDPETVAKRYLEQALRSQTVPVLAAPEADSGTGGLKSLGTETVPLTNTTVVKFRQTLNQIPVYGSLVTVELDQANNLLSVNSSMGAPADIPAVAKIAPADAVKAVAAIPHFEKQLAKIVPQLSYYFDKRSSKWRLVYILEDVPVTSSDEPKDPTKPSTQYMDFIVDAQNAEVVAELPRTPSMAALVEQAVDGKSQLRRIQVDQTGATKTLRDAALNVQTYDFKFGDPQRNEAGLPGAPIQEPPAPWPPAAVSAQANAAGVAQFLRDVLQRNNIDNKGGAMNSSINCVVVRESQDGRQWLNAFWNGSQMVYGQRLDGQELMSLSVDLDVVGHEMFHGVTDHTARLEYAAQSGALNESYSDIFGIIIANFAQADPRRWNWNVGEGLSPNGKPFRNMQDPTLFGQPDHLRDFLVSTLDEDGDWGGVHTNSGIHNKAAYAILTAVDSSNNLVLTPQEVAALFYLTLTQQLSRTSQFSDSLRGVLVSARTFFRNLSAAELAPKLEAIGNAFSQVGITQ